MQDSQPVRQVYVLFKCHLDVGFTDTQEGVLRRYFTEYFPTAMKTAESLRAASESARYCFTTGSWLLYEYLEQADTQTRRRVEQAVAHGDLAWHALPFTWESELLDRPMLEAALQLSRSLDRRFGQRTIAGKMTDVPGHTRGLVAPLAHAGIRLLDIGVNPASPAPDVPDVFRWREPGGAELAVLYHKREYGSTLRIPGTDIAVSINVRGDNSGPQTPEEVKGIFADLSRQFPGAQITACGLSRIASAIEPHCADLPVVTQEIGDSWIYGVPSDPIKIARFRELSRLHGEWVSAGKLKIDSPEERAWSPWLLLCAEHTWGCDVKSSLGDFGIYTPKQVAAARSKPNFEKLETTWAEKRANIGRALAALPPALRSEAEARLEALRAEPPNTDELKTVPDGQPIVSKHFTLRIDPATGAIVELTNRKTGHAWASQDSPLALFRYQTFTQADYDRFFKQYLQIRDWWAPQDFGKTGIDEYPLRSAVWQPIWSVVWAGKHPRGQRVVVRPTMPSAGDYTEYIGWPGRLAMEIVLPDREPRVEICFQWFDKPANRLPEALWLSFSPLAPDPNGWSFDKLESPVSPLDVAKNGSRGLHAVTRDIRYRDASGRFTLQTLDAPVISPGRMSLLNFDNRLPDMAGGVHVSLFNNAWGTNYVMWFGEDARFRFVIA